MVARENIDADRFDRVAKLLVDAGDVKSFDEARDLLERYRFQLVCSSDICRDPAAQAAMLTVVNCGVRAMHGGVQVVLQDDPYCDVPLFGGQRLSSALQSVGANLVTDTQVDLPTVVMGDIGEAPSSGAAPTLWASARGWIADVSPDGSSTLDVPVPGEATAAVLSAALAVSEIFQWFRGHPVAGDRDISISLWDQSDPGAQGPPIRFLPSSLWLLGLGHLGQAYSWVLGMMPYSREAAGKVVLQDNDSVTEANRATSMMHREDTVGQRKTRVVAASLEDAGWNTELLERRYFGGPLRRSDDPLLLLAGVDNRDTRRLLDESGFPLIYDAGLGAGPDGFLGITVRRMPASRPSKELWNEAPPPRKLGAVAAETYAAIEAQTNDSCGVEQLASRTVATAFVGVAAACFVLGSVLRELHGGTAYELLDLSLRDPRKVSVIEAPAGPPARLTSIGRAS
ncbi:MAG: ThiF family adenylyltransferase [Solirubrobacteraceae bacterium]